MSITNYFTVSSATIYLTAPPPAPLALSVPSEVEEIQEEKKTEKEEIWKPIEHHPAYFVSNWGNVRDSCGILLKQHKNVYSDHKTYRLQVKINKRWKKVHRLVALAFIPNPENLPEVDHIDRKPWNNKVENLRWSKHMQNLLNKACLVNSSSKYKGVKRMRKNWAASTTINGKSIYIGTFESEVMAAAAYNKWCQENTTEEDKEFLLLNDIENDPEYLELKQKTEETGWTKPCSSKRKSRYYGVALSGKKYFARVKMNKKTFYVGSFDTEKEAAKAYNKRKLELNGQECKRLNVISDDEQEEDDERSNKRQRNE